MLIEGGKIVVTRMGPTLKFTHIGPDGVIMRALAKQPFMNAHVWRKAQEDWLGNYDEAMPLVKPCGAISTVGAFEQERL